MTLEELRALVLLHPVEAVTIVILTWFIALMLIDISRKGR